MEFFNLLGLMDSFRTKNSSWEKYEEKLHHYQKLEAETLIKIGLIYFEGDQSKEARENFQEALQIYRKLVYLEGEAYMYNLIGDTYVHERKTTQALQNYQDAFKIYSYIKSPYKKDLFEKIKDTEMAQEAIDLVKE